MFTVKGIDLKQKLKCSNNRVQSKNPVGLWDLPSWDFESVC